MVLAVEKLDCFIDVQVTVEAVPNGLHRTLRILPFAHLSRARPKGAARECLWQQHIVNSQQPIASDNVE
jgi:hypothetical protein